MEHIYVLSNAGARLYWWAADQEDRTIRLEYPPGPYKELARTKCYFSTNPGLFVFASAAGQACCLVANVRAGSASGTAIVRHSVLIVSESSNLTPRTKALATMYLGDPPPSEGAGVALQPADGLAPLFQLIVPTKGVVEIDWSELYHRLDSRLPQEESIGQPTGHFFGEDTAENRRRLARLLTGATSVPEGTVLAAVSPGMPIQEMNSEDVMWGLTDRQSLERRSDGESASVNDPKAQARGSSSPPESFRRVANVVLILGAAAAAIYVIRRFVLRFK
jgi:hypothetical protein